MSTIDREITQYLQLTANASCAPTLEISTINRDIQEYKAGSELISDAIISNDLSVNFSANNSITLNNGFSIEAGGELTIEPFNDCQ